MNNIEIERKYLISRLPDGLEGYPHKEYEQAYLCTSPVVRVRREGESHVLTYKSGGLKVREEYNLPLTEDAYSHLREKADGLIISKTRYMIPADGGLTIELDVFHGSLSPLVTAEVEFSSVEEADSYAPPEWFGPDVTEAGCFSNSRLSEHGLPENWESYLNRESS